MNSEEIIRYTLSVKQHCYNILSKKEIECIYKIYSIFTYNPLATVRVVQMAKADLLGISVLVLGDKDNTVFKMNEDKKLHLLKIASITLSHNKLCHNEMLIFLNMFCGVIQVMYNIETSIVKNIGEELMLEVLICLKTLFESVDRELFFLIYTKENTTKLYKIIYVVTEILKSKSRILKTEAIKCLMSLFRVDINLKINNLLSNTLMAKTLSECFSYFLPGISGSLGRVISGGDRIGTRNLELTIDAMGKILTLLLKDYDEKSDSLAAVKAHIMSQMNSSVESELEKSTDRLENFMNLERNFKWFRTSDQHLVPIFEKFTYLANNPSHEIRLKLTEMCISLIKHCYKNIPESAFTLLGMLLIMSFGRVEEDISELMNEFFDDQISAEQVKNILANNFHHIFSKLPSALNGIDNSEKENVLKLTAACLKFMGDKVKCHESFKEFQRILLYICEVETSKKSVEIFSQAIFDGETFLPAQLWRSFKFMDNQIVRCLFGQLCRVIYEVNLFPVLSDYLINVITFGEEKTEALFLMNQLLYGVNEGKLIRKERLFHLVMPAFETYMENWEVPLSINSNDDACTTLKTLKTNILQAALMCEGVGLMSHQAKREEHYRIFLFNAMYKVLIRAASSHYRLRLAATRALQEMALGMGYFNVLDMLNKNMDFFCFYIERGLRGNNNNEVLDVIGMVIRFGDISTIQHYHDWINEVLIQCFDKFKQDRLDSYLKLFRIFLRRVMTLYRIDDSSKKKYDTWQQKKEMFTDIRRGVLGLEPLEPITDFSDEIMHYPMEEEDVKAMLMNKSSNEFVEPKDEPYVKETPPIHVQITIDILKRTLHFLPSKNHERKLLVLEILRNGLEIVKNHEDDLLPIVHLIWSPLVERFKNVESPVILNFSFKLLITMGIVAKDFIRNRTSKEVLPSILSHLSKLAEKNHKESDKHSLDYKLQLSLLENIFDLIYYVELLEEDIDAILDVVILYTNINQPDGLQTAAYSFLNNLSEYSNPQYKARLLKILAKDLEEVNNVD